MEGGMSPFDAAMLGSREIGFTVLSMSTSLIAVFIPILLMGGLMGRLFREFAVVLSVAIAISLVVSLTTTPMLSAKFLEHRGARPRPSLRNWRALRAQQDLNIGARSSATQFQYTLSSQNLEDLRVWTPRIMARMQKMREIRDVNTDQQDLGLLEQLAFDRDTASRLGITAADIDNSLYSAFGQRQVSTIYTTVNQYHVVLSVPESFQRDPESLDGIYLQHGAAGFAGANQASAHSPCSRCFIRNAGHGCSQLRRHD